MREQPCRRGARHPCGMWRWNSGWGARRRGRPSRLLETSLQDRCLARLGPGARRAALFAAAHQLTARSDSIPTGLLPTQARRGKEAPRGDQVPQAQNLRRPLSPTARRPPPRGRCSGWSGSGRALRGVSRIQRGRPTPAHRHFGSATSRTRDTDATTASADLEDLPAANASAHRLTTKGSRKDSRPRRDRSARLPGGRSNPSELRRRGRTPASIGADRLDGAGSSNTRSNHGHWRAPRCAGWNPRARRSRCWR